MDSRRRSAAPASANAETGRGVELVPGLPRAFSALEELDAAENDPPPAWILDGLFEAGDKALLIAPSKTGKTWAALTIALHLAAGLPFWGFRVAKRFRVLYVNLEVKDAWMRRRLRGARAVLGIGAEDLKDTLYFWMMRGKGEGVRGVIEGTPDALGAFDLVILDPRYKLARKDEDENSARDIKGILDAVDKLAGAGPAVLTVAHDGKGDVGSKRKTDRGAGSYAAAADYDAAVILTAHKDGWPRVVVETIGRNAGERKPFVIRLEKAADGVGGCAFVLDEDAAPEKETNATRSASAGAVAAGNIWLPPESYQAAARKALARRPAGLSAGALVSKIRDETRASEKTVKNRLAEMCADGFLKNEKQGRETIYRLADAGRDEEAETRDALFGSKGSGRHGQK